MIVLVEFNELRRGSGKIVKIPNFIFNIFSQVFKNLPKNYGHSLGTDRADITVSSLTLLMKSDFNGSIQCPLLHHQSHKLLEFRFCHNT